MGSTPRWIRLSRRSLRLPCRLASSLELVDLRLGIGHRGIGGGPGEADFQRRKHNVIDDDRLHIRAQDPGVPQAGSGLERFDTEAVVVAGHCVTPQGSCGVKQNTGSFKTNVNSFTSAAFLAESGDDLRRFRVPGLAAAD